MHRQFTDANLSTNVKKPVEFPGAAMTSPVFVRKIDGRPYLVIWGEEHEHESSTRTCNWNE